MYRDHEGDRNLLIAASEELVSRGLLRDATFISNDIRLDDESKQKLIDYYCEFNLQHELFRDILEVGDPHYAPIDEVSDVVLRRLSLVPFCDTNSEADEYLSEAIINELEVRGIEWVGPMWEPPF
jgi:hypothetical protein